MATILHQSKDFNKVELYLLTQSEAAISLRDVEDKTEITATGYVLYTVERNGDEITLLSLITDDKTVYSTVSTTFTNQFLEIWDLLDTDCVPVIKDSGLTNNGRTYLKCLLNTSALI